jgi:hypothetical protein
MNCNMNLYVHSVYFKVYWNLSIYGYSRLPRHIQASTYLMQHIKIKAIQGRKIISYEMDATLTV